LVNQKPERTYVCTDDGIFRGIKSDSIPFHILLKGSCLWHRDSRRCNPTNDPEAIFIYFVIDLQIAVKQSFCPSFPVHDTDSPSALRKDRECRDQCIGRINSITGICLRRVFSTVLLIIARVDELSTRARIILRMYIYSISYIYIYIYIYIHTLYIYTFIPYNFASM